MAGSSSLWELRGEAQFVWVCVSRWRRGVWSSGSTKVSNAGQSCWASSQHDGRSRSACVLLASFCPRHIRKPPNPPGQSPEPDRLQWRGRTGKYDDTDKQTALEDSCCKLQFSCMFALFVVGRDVSTGLCLKAHHSSLPSVHDWHRGICDTLPRRPQAGVALHVYRHRGRSPLQRPCQEERSTPAQRRYHDDLTTETSENKSELQSGMMFVFWPAGHPVKDIYSNLLRSNCKQKCSGFPPKWITELELACLEMLWWLTQVQKGEKKPYCLFTLTLLFFVLCTVGNCVDLHWQC